MLRINTWFYLSFKNPLAGQVPRCLGPCNKVYWILVTRLNILSWTIFRGKPGAQSVLCPEQFFHNAVIMDLFPKVNKFCISLSFICLPFSVQFPFKLDILKKKNCPSLQLVVWSVSVYHSFQIGRGKLMTSMLLSEHLFNDLFYIWSGTFLYAAFFFACPLIISWS